MTCSWTTDFLFPVNDRGGRWHNDPKSAACWQFPHGLSASKPFLFFSVQHRRRRVTQVCTPRAKEDGAHTYVPGQIYAGLRPPTFTVKGGEVDPCVEWVPRWQNLPHFVDMLAAFMFDENQTLESHTTHRSEPRTLVGEPSRKTRRKHTANIG